MTGCAVCDDAHVQQCTVERIYRPLQAGDHQAIMRQMIDGYEAAHCPLRTAQRV